MGKGMGKGKGKRKGKWKENEREKGRIPDISTRLFCYATYIRKPSSLGLFWF